MTVDLKGFTALITGASSGMGYEMAKALLSHGATVIISARPGEKLEKAYLSLKTLYPEVYAVPMDVTDEDSVTKAAEWFREHFDRLDMLVNNAGIGNNAPGMDDFPAEHAFYEMPVSAFKTIVETNFVGYFIVSGRFVPIMAEQGYGRVVYVSTSTSTITRQGQIPYGPSKAAAEAMSAIMSGELKAAGITVNVICPGGFTDTNMAGKGMKEHFLKNNLPILKPDVMNKAILFLASPAAEGMTGEKLVGKEMEEWLKNRGLTLE